MTVISLLLACYGTPKIVRLRLGGPHCSPSGLLAACQAVQLVRWRGWGVALGSAGWALAEGRRGGTAPGGRTRPVEKAV